MHTICPNIECRQEYKIRPEMVGSMARCKKCNEVFIIEAHQKQPAFIQIDPQACEETDPHESPSEKHVNDIMTLLADALQRQVNESDTRIIIDKMIQKILGYNLTEIKTEQRIEGRKADYVLQIGNEAALVIEAKKIGMNLNPRQAFQATSYGAQSGIKWVVLTNAVVWQLYHISTGDKIETDLVFTIELRDGLDDEEAYYFYLLSKAGMSRKYLLEGLWRKISALCNDNIVEAILSEEVITRIRTSITKKTGYSGVNNDEIRAAIESNLFQLG